MINNHHFSISNELPTISGAASGVASSFHIVAAIPDYNLLFLFLKLSFVFASGFIGGMGGKFAAHIWKIILPIGIKLYRFIILKIKRKK